jgi:thymidine kinase
MIVTQALRAEAKTIGIDEAQFLQGNHYPFLDAVQRMVTHHEMRLIIAGLDMDWKGQPFGPMGDLLACADIVTKLWARCPCGKKATMTLRGPEHGEGQIVVGDEEIYQPRCRACWSKEMRARPGFAPLDGSRWP